MILPIQFFCALMILSIVFHTLAELNTRKNIFGKLSALFSKRVGKTFQKRWKNFDLISCAARWTDLKKIRGEICEINFMASNANAAYFCGTNSLIKTTHIENNFK